jgi:hypothetical protein
MALSPSSNDEAFRHPHLHWCSLLKRISKRLFQNILPFLALEDLAVVYGFEDRGSWSEQATGNNA